MLSFLFRYKSKLLCKHLTHIFLMKHRREPTQVKAQVEEVKKLGPRADLTLKDKAMTDVEDKAVPDVANLSDECQPPAAGPQEEGGAGRGVGWEQQPEKREVAPYVSRPMTFNNPTYYATARPRTRAQVAPIVTSAMTFKNPNFITERHVRRAEMRKQAAALRGAVILTGFFCCR
jgi:hypothetical protein